MALQILDNGYRDIFNHTPVALMIVATDAPTYTILAVNEAYLKTTGSTRSDLIGKSVFAAFPENPTLETSRSIALTIQSFDDTIRFKTPQYRSSYRYDIPVRGTNQFEESYWTNSNTPILDENGNVTCIINSPTNVTEAFKQAERQEAGLEEIRSDRQQLYATFMQAPVGIAIFMGAEFMVDLINPPLCQLYERTVDEMLGKPVFEVLTEIKGRGFEELLESVRTTGTPFKGRGMPTPLVRDGKLETAYLDFVYEPFREDDGTISGVIVVVTEVTEQVNAQLLLKEAEERSRLAVDAVGLGTFDLDLNTGEMITSPIFAKIFGFEEPVPREEYVSVFHPDDLELRQKAHAEALVNGSLFYEARVIWPDRTIHWARIEGKVYYDDADNAVRILGTLLDITNQKRAVEEQQKLTTLVANSVDLMSILEMSGINSYINDAGKKMLGFESDGQVQTIPISELHAPEDFDLVQNEVLPSVMIKGRWAGRMLVRHLQTGEIFPVFNHCIRIDDPHTGNTIGIGAVMRDLRPEIAAKKALADSEQLLRNITTAAPTGLWMADASGAMTYVNQTWIEWSGMPYDAHLGWGWLACVVAEDRGWTSQKFISVLKSQSMYEAEFRILHADGTLHWCIATGMPQYLADGTFSGFIGACTDITEQKLLQQQKDDFIGIASHELKTPVTSIKAYTQVLERMLLKKGDEKEAGMIAKMDTQLNRLTSLIGDLLDVTKINSGKLQFDDQDFDFNSHIHEMLEDLQRTTEKHQLIEAFGESSRVFADKERIGQVITNLITNAIKYSPDADKIVISTAVQSNEITFCVEDFGIGISDDSLKHVFEQFYRVSGKMQHTFPGLGLGLYISSEIVKREGGKIWATSVEGKGSKFCFSLPIKK